MFIVVVVVAIPSTLIVLSDSTFQNKDDGQAGKKRMFPGNSHVKNWNLTPGRRAQAKGNNRYIVPFSWSMRKWEKLHQFIRNTGRPEAQMKLITVTTCRKQSFQMPSREANIFLMVNTRQIQLKYLCNLRLQKTFRSTTFFKFRFLTQCSGPRMIYFLEIIEKVLQH